MTVKFDIESVPADDRERVASLIPDPRLADAYIHRGVFGIDEFELFDAAVEERENIILAGPTGSSKTTVFRAYAASRQLPCAIVECTADMQPSAVVGRTTIAPDGSVSFIDGDMTLAVRYGGVVLLDDVNMAHSRITAAWFQLLAVTRRMSLHEAGETVIAGRGGIGDPQPTLFGSAYNPRYQGVVRLNEALLNRFAIPLDWDYDRGVEAQLVRSASLLDQAYMMRSLSEIRTPVSTNMLMEFERHVSRFGLRAASLMFRSHFAPEERGPVWRALEANSRRIASELDTEFETLANDADPEPATPEVD